LTNQTFGNSDDVALIGGLCIPLFLLFASRLGKVLGTLVGAAGVVACLAAIGLSAARFAMISLAVMALVYFFPARAAQKIGLIICFTALLAGSIFFLPKATLTRFSTISALLSEDEGATSVEAVASMREREQLSRDAIQAFISHPILGVGPNVFVDWRWDTLHRHGQPAHDSYLQAAAEDGILGIIFYSAFLISALITVNKSTKSFPGWEDGSQVARALQPALVYFMVSAFFINALSHAHQFLFAGLAVALDRIRLSQFASADVDSTTGVPNELKEPETSKSPSKSSVRPPLPRVSEQPARPQRYRFNRPIATSSRKD
jgi:O-antigen ligase